MTKFQEKVWQITKKIPRGKVTTYKQIATKIGSSKKARAVGNALNKNPFAPNVPCHRVICSNGKIGGFAKGTQKKIKLLKSEGVEIVNNLVDLSKFGV